MVAEQKSTRLQALVADLELRIFSGEFEPGEHLKEVRFTQELGHSRGLIREAFKLLEQTGVVQVVPHKGVFVRDYSLTETLEMFDLRAHLALMAVKQATLNISPKIAQELKRKNQEMIESFNNDRPGDAMQQNWDFHRAIYSLCDNSLLVELLDDLNKKQTLSCLRSFKVSTSVNDSTDEHCQIIDYLVDGDCERAAKAMHDHILQGKHRFMSLLQQLNKEKE
ncbi:GntR family transcriptional regulator [Photobacterium minamisatsumaniensis]|uniref:GntR family transcriptional regulator n=1 Tax=Photobacterium minamisatsumaniensis TaxID=2910233 RepID=UPI003D13A646